MNTNNSFFSPNRLVFMAHGPSKAPEAGESAAKKPQAGVDTKAKRQELFKKAEDHLAKMGAKHPDKAQFEKVLAQAKAAEAKGSKHHKIDHAMHLFEQLAVGSGNKALENRATLARKEIQRQRKIAYNGKKRRMVSYLSSMKRSGRLKYDQAYNFSVNGKNYATSARKNGTFWTREV